MKTKDAGAMFQAPQRACGRHGVCCSGVYEIGVALLRHPNNAHQPLLPHTQTV